MAKKANIGLKARRLSPSTAKVGLSRRKQLNRKTLIAVAVVAALIGSYIIYHSFAATIPESAEAESGTLPAPLTLVSDATASGGSAIQFHASNLPYLPPYWGDCIHLSTNFGTAQVPIEIPADGYYSLWARMMVPDTTNSDFIMGGGGGGGCYYMGGSTLTPNTWTWVNYQKFNPSFALREYAYAGTQSVQLRGSSDNVKVDRVLFLSDASCIPVDTGENCASTPAPPSVTPPTGGSSVATSTNQTTAPSTPVGSSSSSVKAVPPAQSAGPITSTGQITSAEAVVAHTRSGTDSISQALSTQHYLGVSSRFFPARWVAVAIWLILLAAIFGMHQYYTAKKRR